MKRPNNGGSPPAEAVRHGTRRARPSRLGRGVKSRHGASSVRWARAPPRDAWRCSDTPWDSSSPRTAARRRAHRSRAPTLRSTPRRGKTIRARQRCHAYRFGAARSSTSRHIVGLARTHMVRASFVGLQMAENRRISVPTDHVATTTGRWCSPDDVHAADRQLAPVRRAQFGSVQMDGGRYSDRPAPPKAIYASRVYRRAIYSCSSACFGGLSAPGAAGASSGRPSPSIFSGAGCKSAKSTRLTS